MSEQIPSEARHLIEGKNFAHVATVNEDGSPQVSPVWVEAENGTVSFNTAEGRVKPKNIRRDPRVSLSIHNEENPYENILVRGRAEIVDEDADEQADRLAKKYLDEDKYPFRQPGEVRVKVKVTPEKVAYTPSS